MRELLLYRGGGTGWGNYCCDGMGVLMLCQGGRYGRIIVVSGRRTG